MPTPDTLTPAHEGMVDFTVQVALDAFWKQVREINSDCTRDAIDHNATMGLRAAATRAVRSWLAHNDAKEGM